ncbi:MAG: hypothetical protein COV44_02000 [Deltaproteobacteria bacterium CG11_big_fil_rev_8_21_14_0_20_45_16]|nr:MAG: hypothetical protein COV44_02000 [Deltaproteobacteria bacterium CG11_big_fil_rev_8_21_14_0_20_45_16]
MGIKFKPDSVLRASVQIPAALNQEEAYLWSRLGSPIQFKDLQSLCPWPEEKFLEILKSLHNKSGLGQLEKPTATAPSKSISVSAEVRELLQGDKFDPVAKEIDEKFRRECLIRLEKSGNDNPFENLDLSVSASDEAVRRSYLELSKRFHPDRFFRKNLGPYRKRVNQLFTIVQKSYERIKNPHDREAEARKLRLKDRVEATTPKAAKSKPRRMDPEIERIGKAEMIYKQGLEAEAQSRFVEAANHFQMASQLNPEKNLYEKALQKIRPELERYKASEFIKSAKKALELGLADDALLASEQAMKMDPQNFEAAVLAAKSILKCGMKERIQDAFEMLRRAKVNLPKNAEACFLLGQVYQVKREEDKAILEYEEALRRDPQMSLAKNYLIKLRGE